MVCRSSIHGGRGAEKTRALTAKYPRSNTVVIILLGVLLLLLLLLSYANATAGGRL